MPLPGPIWFITDRKYITLKRYKLQQVLAFIQVKTVTDRERVRNCNKYNMTVSKNDLTDYKQNTRSVQ